jgi:hypothetical protein
VPSVAPSAPGPRRRAAATPAAPSASAQRFAAVLADALAA